MVHQAVVELLRSVMLLPLGQLICSLNIWITIVILLIKEWFMHTLMGISVWPSWWQLTQDASVTAPIWCDIVTGSYHAKLFCITILCPSSKEINIYLYISTVLFLPSKYLQENRCSDVISLRIAPSWKLCSCYWSACPRWDTWHHHQPGAKQFCFDINTVINIFRDNLLAY